MSVTIFEVLPHSSSEGRFIYTIDTTTGDVLPFSAISLQKIETPFNATFNPIGGSLDISSNNEIILKKGNPYIIVTDHGPAIGWFMGNDFDLQKEIKEHFPLKIPRRLVVEPNTSSIEAVPTLYEPMVVRKPESLIQKISITQGPVVPSPINVQTVPIIPKDDIVDPGSPQIAITSRPDMKLKDRLSYVEALLEAHLRREYRLYNNWTLPDKLPIEGQLISLTSFDVIQDKMGKGEIERFELNPVHQPFAGSTRTANRILTFHSKSGEKYLVNASYDPKTNQIGPVASS